METTKNMTKSEYESEQLGSERTLVAAIQFQQLPGETFTFKVNFDSAQQQVVRLTAAGEVVKQFNSGDGSDHPVFVSDLNTANKNIPWVIEDFKVLQGFPRAVGRTVFNNSKSVEFQFEDGADSDFNDAVIKLTITR